ncbi:hypothetical protein F5X97DRAFT_283784, partial [Nemania serpens]
MMEVRHRSSLTLFLGTMTIPADTVPKYTREYLQGLPNIINARLKTIEDDVSYYPNALTKTRRAHRCLAAVLTILGLLWLATSVVILVAVAKTYNQKQTGSSNEGYAL